MDLTVVLNDGTELTGSHVLESDGMLWLYVRNGMGIRDLFDILRDSENVRVIQVKETGARYRGYKEIFSIRADTDGQVYAGLRKQ